MKTKKTIPSGTIKEAKQFIKVLNYIGKDGVYLHFKYICIYSLGEVNAFYYQK